VSAPEGSRIKAVVLDVDGVLTDGVLYWGPAGEELKRISFVDIMGLSIGRRAGLRFALVSGEDGPLLERLVDRLGISDVYRGCKDKGEALRDFANRAGLDLAQICYMGDDLNDVPAMEIAGLPAAPAGAHSSARTAAQFITSRGGGNGAVRELVDALLTSGIPVRRTTVPSSRRVSVTHRKRAART
jgi:3-deoxy-D-manno-octulosonate 8-phosphate phosphatase (KDO 8-P phosphatase)